MFYCVVNNQIHCADYKFENNCKEYKGLTLDEYSLHPNKVIIKGDIIIANPNYEQEEREHERERISRLSMTKQDFFNHVLKPQGFTYDALMQIVDGSEDYKVAWNLCERVYRRDKNLIGAIATFLPKLTEEELDNLFIEYGV